MRVVDLFSGIGGFSLGFERVGFQTVAFSEIDPYASAVLRKHWPGVPNLGDITAVTARDVPDCELICGGFPCQPFSCAGRRLGTSDKRHLWPEMLRVVAGKHPRWIVGENVPGIGKHLDPICRDLEAEGYHVLLLDIPAAAFGAPHLRHRVWIIAHARGERRQQDTGSAPCDEVSHEGRAAQDDHEPTGVRETISNAPCSGQLRTEQLENDCCRERRSSAINVDAQGKVRRKDVAYAQRVGQPAPGHSVHDRTQTLLGQTDQSRGQGQDGRAVAHAPGERLERRGNGIEGIDAQALRLFPAGPGESADTWAVEPDVGRVAHGIPSRVDRLRCLGNAIVPQVAEWIGIQINKIEQGV